MTPGDADARVRRASLIMALGTLAVATVSLGWVLLTAELFETVSTTDDGTWEVVALVPLTATALAGLALLPFRGRRRLVGVVLILGLLLAAVVAVMLFLALVPEGLYA